MKAPREVAAVRDIHLLRMALKALVDDTQHFEHQCEDTDCPVRMAKRALHNTQAWGERPCMTKPTARAVRAKDNSGGK